MLTANVELVKANMAADEAERLPDDQIVGQIK